MLVSLTVRSEQTVNDERIPGDREKRSVGNLEFFSSVDDADNNGELQFIDEENGIAISISKSPKGFMVISQKHNAPDESIAFLDSDGDGRPEKATKTVDGAIEAFKVTTRLIAE